MGGRLASFPARTARENMRRSAPNSRLTVAFVTWSCARRASAYAAMRSAHQQRPGNLRVPLRSLGAVRLLSVSDRRFRTKRGPAREGLSTGRGGDRQG